MTDTSPTLTEAEHPKGVIAIFTDERGRVIATADDFAPDKPGGYSLKDAQKYRAERRLPTKVVAAYASPGLGRGITEYYAGLIIQELTSNHGCKVTFIYVGHDDD
jgi:hypothetical protein